MCHQRQIAIATTIFCLVIGPLPAADLTKVLDPSASILVRLDIHSFDTSQVLTVLKKIVGEQQAQQLLPAQIMISGAVQSLRDAAVDELYISFATQDLSNSFPAFIIPTMQPDRVTDVARSLLAMAPRELNLQLYEHAIGLVIAHESTWQRMQSQANVQPSGLRSHYRDHTSATLSVTLGFNRDVKDAVVDVWPDQLPTKLGLPISPRKLMRDIDALSLVCELNPQFSLSVVAACRDSSAAARVSSDIQPLLQTAGMTLDGSGSDVAVTVHQEQLNDLLSPFIQSGQSSQAQMQVSNHMKQIMLAMHNFHQRHQAFPPRMTVSADGRELLSWRVFLLPYLGEEALYIQFRLNEAWDSPHNRMLIDKMPALFADPESAELPAGRTRLQFVLTEGSVWKGEEDRLLKFQDITDGTSNTICLLEVPRDKAVVWSQPADFEVGNDELAKTIFAGRDTVQAGYFDGSIRQLSLEQAEQIRSLLTGNGGEVIQR